MAQNFIARQPLRPTQDVVDLPIPQPRVRATRGELDAPAAIPSGVRMLERFLRHLMFGKPAASGVMQVSNALGRFPLQTAA